MWSTILSCFSQWNCRTTHSYQIFWRCLRDKVSVYLTAINNATGEWLSAILMEHADQASLPRHLADLSLLDVWSSLVNIICRAQTAYLQKQPKTGAERQFQGPLLARVRHPRFCSPRKVPSRSELHRLQQHCNLLRLVTQSTNKFAIVGA